jgi:hypothetical protein
LLQTFFHPLTQSELDSKNATDGRLTLDFGGNHNN